VQSLVPQDMLEAIYVSISDVLRSQMVRRGKMCEPGKAPPVPFIRDHFSESLPLVQKLVRLFAGVDLESGEFECSAEPAYQV
jgi:hypothetical protein